MAVVSCIWSKKECNGTVPSPRFGHKMILVGETIFLFGGSRTTDAEPFEYFNDIYQITDNNGSFEWEKLHIHGRLPQPRDCHSMCVVEDRIYVFGGKNELSTQKCSAEVFYFDLKNRNWTEVQVAGLPPCAIGYTACVINRRVCAFGGILDGSSVQDTYFFSLDTNEWTPIKCSGTVPEPRCDHTCVAVDDIIYMFGGTSGPEHFYNDLYSFEIENYTWTKIKAKGIPPTPRAGHSFVAHRNKDIYVYGGYGDPKEKSESNLIHKFSIGSRKWKQPLTSGETPSAINLHGHCSVIMHSTMYVFGGIGVKGEMELNRVFALKLINPSFRKPVIEHMLNDFCKQSNSLSCWLPTAKPNISYKTEDLDQSIQDSLRTTLADSLPLNTKLVKKDFLESEDLESQRSLLIAARAELAQAKQLFEDNRMELIKLLERERKDAQYLMDRHQKQNEDWWKARIAENDIERTKLKRAWEEIEEAKFQLKNEQENLQKKAHQVAHLIKQLT